MFLWNVFLFYDLELLYTIDEDNKEIWKLNLLNTGPIGPHPIFLEYLEIDKNMVQLVGPHLELYPTMLI